MTGKGKKQKTSKRKLLLDTIAPMSSTTVDEQKGTDVTSFVSALRARKLNRETVAATVTLVIIIAVVTGYFWPAVGKVVFFPGAKVLAYASSQSSWGGLARFIGFSAKAGILWTAAAWGTNLVSWVTLGGAVAYLVDHLLPEDK